MSARHPAAEAIATRGWLRAHRWLLLRRASQLAILAAFLSGPLFGFWISKGNLASSLTLDLLPLTDPFAFLQMLASGHRPAAAAVTGVLIVTAFYLLAGGRLFCAWVCPMNAVTDAAAWLRRRLGLKGGRSPHPATRYWLLGAVLIASALTGLQVWEWVNPVSMLQRGLIFGAGSAWLIVGGLFVYDFAMAGRGWCSHLCPVGACYALLDRPGLLRISAHARRDCDDCMDCFTVCPEPQVIRPALKAVGQRHPLILASACTRCGRCIDVCSKDVFRLGSRFNRSEK